MIQTDSLYMPPGESKSEREKFLFNLTTCGVEIESSLESCRSYLDQAGTGGTIIQNASNNINNNNFQ